MDFEIDLTEIITVIITLLSALITSYVIPLISQTLSTTKQEKLQFWVETAVKAAEQLFGSSTGEEKKEYVVSFLLEKGIVVDVDEVTVLIESEVYKLQSALESSITESNSQASEVEDTTNYESNENELLAQIEAI